jgi:osmotically-inducible protein OsmY
MHSEDDVMTFATRTDHELKTAVVAEIAAVANVNSDHVGVAVTDGVVTLSGRVDSYPERCHAGQAALRVQGVTAVAEELTVRGRLESSGTAIAREAHHALGQATDVPKGSVQVLVQNNVLTLSGSTPWQFQRVAAERAVRSIPGVRSISNNLRIERRQAQTTAGSAPGVSKVTCDLVVRA